MQNNSSPLNNLADIHLPTAVSWWPLAPGWWILLGLIILAVIALLWQRKRKQRNHYRVIARQELERAYTATQDDSAAYLQQVSTLLRRTALSAFPASFNSSIKGEEWLAWLDSTCPAFSDSFLNGSGRALLLGQYQKNPDVDTQALHQLSLHWIKTHHNQWQKKSPAKTTEANHV